MTQTLQHRKPSAPRRNGAISRQPAQPAKRRRLSRGYSVFLLAMAYGCTVALLVVTVGFATLLRNGTAVTEEALQLQGAGGGGGHSHGNNNSGPQPNIRIEARHLGNLVVDIKAEISMNQDNDPLIQAKVVAFTDMVQMPNVHTQGPLSLQPAPGRPGLYQTTTDLSMPGDYDIRVVVEDPVQGEKTVTIPVNATYTGNRPEQTEREKEY